MLDYLRCCSIFLIQKPASKSDAASDELMSVELPASSLISPGSSVWLVVVWAVATEVGSESSLSLSEGLSASGDFGFGFDRFCFLTFVAFDNAGVVVESAFFFFRIGVGMAFGDFELKKY